jgi:acetate kinase
MTKHLLILNNGSSSLKFAVWELKSKLGQELMSGSVTLLAGRSVLSYRLKNKNYKINYQAGYNLNNWWRYIYNVLKDYDLRMVGLRMVHGGAEFNETTRITKSFLQRIKKYNKLAPLHNPVTLELIKLLLETWPRIKMAVSFDTAWYKDLAPEAYLYGLPLNYAKDYGLRKYGFHGLSHEMATRWAALKLQKNLNNLSVVTCHLGSGNSLTWYVNGKVKDTTMGFSTNEGLIMSTRSGDVPAGLVLYLSEELKMSASRIEDLLDRKSGLLGLAGLADLREVLVAAGYRVSGFRSSLKYSQEQKQRAKLALQVYIYSLRKHLGAYLAMSPKLDAIVFTGAVGARSKIVRSLVLSNLVKPKNCKILTLEDSETKNLANKTIKCLA